MLKTKELLLKITEAIKENDCTTAGLLTGNIGIAIFLAYVNQLYNRADISEVMENSLHKCFKSLEANGSIHNYADGLAGICWGINHLVIQNKIDADVNSLFEELELPLFSKSENDLNYHFFDFIHGGLGAGIYALNRLHDAKAINHIIKAINFIYQSAEMIDGDVKWKTIIEVGENLEKTEYNLGLSHGMPSIIWFLCKSYDANIETQKCSTLINGSINWLLKQKLSAQSISLFPSAVESSRKKKHSRLGWCYGDLGIASTIWQAGKSLNNEQLKQEAIAIMLHNVKRNDFSANGIFDAGLCHGTAGIAHIFNRFYFETKMPIFKETASFWINETLKMASHKDGLAGFKTMRDNVGLVNEYNLLEGIAGIGLALYSHITDEEPTWDRCLLLS